jgi:hypothetical protein
MSTVVCLGNHSSFCELIRLGRKTPQTQYRDHQRSLIFRARKFSSSWHSVYYAFTYSLVMASTTEEDDILDSDYLIILVLFVPLWTWILIHLFPSSISLCVVFIIMIRNSVWMVGYMQKREQLRWSEGRTACRLPTIAWGGIMRHLMA